MDTEPDRIGIAKSGAWYVRRDVANYGVGGDVGWDENSFPDVFDFLEQHSFGMDPGLFPMVLRRNKLPNLEYIEGDYDHPQLGQVPFDVAAAFFCGLKADSHDSIQSVMRLLRPGGILLTTWAELHKTGPGSYEEVSFARR
jgi:SAM-dependent methyltransferase